MGGTIPAKNVQSAFHSARSEHDVRQLTDKGREEPGIIVDPGVDETNVRRPAKETSQSTCD